MKLFTPEQIKQANEIDVLTYLINYEPEELVKVGINNYTTRSHDSLKISNGMWYWFSKGVGGRSALSYLMNVKDLSFKSAMKVLTKIPISELDIQCNRINIYYNNFFNLHLRDIFGKALITKKYWGVIKKAIFLTNEENVNEIEKHNDTSGYINFITYKDINSEEQNHLLKKLDINYKNTYCDNKFCDNVIKLITRGRWHSYKDGDENIKPTKKQLELSVSKSGGQKIKGVAGSGKTQVLAWRAVNAQVRTGGKILILTFNLTLVNYIKYRINQVAADFNWAQFDITNYHQFFKSQANNHNIKAKIGDWDNSKFFDSVSDKTIKYDTIFFDEAQDYRYEWYLLVKNNFSAKVYHQKNR